MKLTLEDLRALYRPLPNSASKKLGLRCIKDAMHLKEVKGGTPSRVLELEARALYHFAYAQAFEPVPRRWTLTDEGAAALRELDLKKAS
jgi:hypothetical protein